MKSEGNEPENLSGSSGKRKPQSAVKANPRSRTTSKSKIAELDSLKKSVVSLFTLPQKFEEKSLTVFLKTKLKIKETFINKNLLSVRNTIMKSLTPGAGQLDPVVGEAYIDYLLSVYISIQNNMNRVDGDDSSSIYNMTEAKKDLVEKNKEKDETIKRKIQDTIIESLTVSDTENIKISSYSFVRSLLNAFDQFMRNGSTTVSDSQVDKILDYLVTLIDFEEPEHTEMDVEESKSAARQPVSRTDSKDEKKVKKSKSKDSKSRLSSAKIEKEISKKEEKEPEAKEEEVDELSLVVPAVLNFISNYFLSRTPQDMDLTEVRKKRIERRKKIAEIHRKSKIALKDADQDNDDMEEDKDENSIDGFKKEIFYKKEDLKDANGNPQKCTFAETRKEYKAQPWYMCYTCGLEGSEGICTMCAKTCHKDHEVVYAKVSSFFCDCQFKFDCVCLPDEFKDKANKRNNGLEWGGFDYDISPSNNDPSWKREFGRGGYAGGGFMRGRGGRGGRGGPRGRGGRGGRGGRDEREEFEEYRKMKKMAKKVNRSNREEYSKGLKYWEKSNNPASFTSPNAFLQEVGIVPKKFKAFEDFEVPKNDSLCSDSESSSDSMNDLSGYFDEDKLAAKKASKPKKPNLMGDHALDDMCAEEEELILGEDFADDELVLEQLREEALFGAGDNAKRVKYLEEIIQAKRAEKALAQGAPMPEDDDDDGEGEGEEGDDEDIFLEEHKDKELHEEEYKELNKHDESIPSELSQDVQDLPSIPEEEDKKMEETEEEFKSISSADVKMDKDGSKGMNILKDADSSSRQEDIIMEEENEDFLDQYNRPYELFKRSDKTTTIPKKLLDKFQELLKKVKKRISSSNSEIKKSNSGGSGDYFKILKNITEADKKTLSNISGCNPNTGVTPIAIKSGCKSGDDSASNLLIGLPGQTDYQIPVNCFACNSVGLLAIAEGDIISFVITNNIILNPQVVLKSVGIGFNITQLKYHPNNDGFLVVYGNKQCLIVSLDLQTFPNSNQVNLQNVKVLQTIKVDLMLEQLGGGLYIVD